MDTTANIPRISQRTIIVLLSLFLAVVFIRNALQDARLMQFEYCEGDIIFQSLSRGNDLIDAIEGATQSEWSHCGGHHARKPIATLER